MKPVLSIDVGTSNVRAILIDEKGTLLGICQKALHTHHPFKGHTETNPEEIFSRTLEVVDKVLCMTGIQKKNLAAIGIANARETAILWDKNTGKPYWNAILWHDTRSKDFCEKNKSFSKTVKEKTGLPLSSYGSATKIKWILENAKGVNIDDCLFGTINTWLLWRLSGGAVFKTDITNASRTLLFNIHTKEWDRELLDFFHIDEKILPTVCSSSEHYGNTSAEIFGAQIKVCSMIGDAQSALFAAGCHKQGDLHASLGTGTFLLAHTGDKVQKTTFPLVSSVAASRKNHPVTYCIEGSVFSTGAVIEWLKSHLGIIRSAKEIEGLACSVPDTLGTYFAPIIHGSSSIENGENIRGSFLGLSAGTNIGHLCRATLEGISYMIVDAFEKVVQELDAPLTHWKCSGGMAENVFLMQMLADLTNIPVVRPKNLELSAFGAGYLAGLAVGIWKDEQEIASLFNTEKKFSPELSEEDRMLMKKHWKKALSTVISYSKNTTE